MMILEPNVFTVRQPKKGKIFQGGSAKKDLEKG
jgi:hypothetical protein